jgi:hypothetical protein
VTTPPAHFQVFPVTDLDVLGSQQKPSAPPAPVPSPAPVEAPAPVPPAERVRRPAPASGVAVGTNWQSQSDPEVESARIWQLQLSLFPVTPHVFCERMGLNWLAACQLHADGWLSFDPRNVAKLNEALRQAVNAPEFG